MQGKSFARERIGVEGAYFGTYLGRTEPIAASRLGRPFPRSDHPPI